jgi:hypothetical protein
MDYKARMYDPSLGRFLQPDSIIPGMGNPQSLNRFSYVGNSPIGFNDPTGHMQACGINGEDACPGHDNPPPLPSSSGGNGGNGGNHKDHDEDKTPENLVNTVVNSYIGGWATFGAAWSNTWNPNASIGSKIIGNYYMSAWLAGHVLLGVGAGYLAYAAYAAVSTAVAGCAVNTPCQQKISQTPGQVVDYVTSGVYNRIGGRLEELSNSPGWKLTWDEASTKGQNIVARIAESSSTRSVPYFRVTAGSFGGLTADGVANSTNAALTHININMTNPSETIDLIVQLVLGVHK